MKWKKRSNKSTRHFPLNDSSKLALAYPKLCSSRVMTFVSVILGRIFHYVDQILPFRFGDTDLPVDDIAAVCLLMELSVKFAKFN
ncbi:hypothetical protein L6164_028289 [Bauhinia variegata]|uniref:Uncharacterized protein n=1 Tax=Bauhinia variegata TaxID=167791 RepID=A0ACB9LY35_BAUVA|nr:hypothetical protein L6164_028289 [Bauhinia variegata]